MSWSRWASFWALSLALGVPACTGESEVAVHGESGSAKRGEAPRSDSTVFDGRRVDLRGVRGETLGLGVRVSEEARRVRLRLPEAAARVESFAVRSIEVREPSSSMYGESRGRGSYPDVLMPSKDGVRTNEQAYFDVAIRPDARPGRYSGRLEIDARSFEVTLVVDRESIDLDKQPLVWVFYLPKEIARAHNVPEDDGAALLELESKYYELFRAHGALLAADLRPDRFPPRRRFVRDVRYWPVALDLSSDEAIAADVRAWIELFQGSNVTPFAIPVDEPHTADQRARARHVAEVIGRAGGGAPRLLRAVTDVPSPDYGGAFDLFFAPTNKVPPPSERSQKFFTYNGKPPAAGSMILDTDGVALRTWGWIAFRYDIGLWYAWEGLYFTDRYNGGAPKNVVTHPITFDERLKGGSDWGNGDGVLAYPGPLPSLRLKALRRGLSDRLLLQKLASCGGGAEARQIAERTVPRALAEARGRATWPIQESDWERARRSVLDAIEVHCGKTAHVAR
jgi:hypothetical protein